jgi:hypothetical protein
MKPGKDKNIFLRSCFLDSQRNSWIPGFQIQYPQISQIENESGKQEKRRDDLETMKPGETFPAFLLS